VLKYVKNYVNSNLQSVLAETFKSNGFLIIFIVVVFLFLHFCLYFGVGGMRLQPLYNDNNVIVIGFCLKPSKIISF